MSSGGIGEAYWKHLARSDTFAILSISVYMGAIFVATTTAYSECKHLLLNATYRYKANNLFDGHNHVEFQCSLLVVNADNMQPSDADNIQATDALTI